MGGTSHKYWAFISYSHRDKAWGDWLHRSLETYRIPAAFVGRASAEDEIPARLYPVFRDRDELPTASDLGASIREALELSRCLIVICSPPAAGSRWVNEEVKVFRSLGRENRILALVVAGDPATTTEIDPEVLPPALRDLRAERPGAFHVVDVRLGASTKAQALLALVAKILSVDPKELETQDRKRKTRRRVFRTAALAAILATFFGVWFYQRVQAKRAVRLARIQRLSDLGRRQLLEKVDHRALVYLAKAYELGGDSPELRRMLGWSARETLPLLSLQHPAGVRAAQFSGNGQRILTIDGLGTARVWDAGRGEPLGHLDEPVEHARLGTRALDFDGTRVVSVVAGNRVRVWKAADGSPLASLDGHSDAVTTACFSPDGQRVLTASHDGTAKVWDAESGQLLATVASQPGSVKEARFSPDGQRILTVLDDGTASLWLAADGSLIADLDGYGSLESVGFSPDGTRLVVAAADGTLSLWNGVSGELVRELAAESYEMHEDLVVSISFAADGKRFVTVDRDDKCNIWNAETGELLQSGDSSEGFVFDGEDESTDFGSGSPKGASVAVDPSARRLVIGQPDGRFEVRSPDGWLLGSVPAHSGPVSTVAFDRSGKRFLTASSSDPVLHVWQRDQGSAAALRDGVFSQSPVSPDASVMLLTDAIGPRAELWDVATGAIRGELIGHRDYISRARFSPDGSRIVTVSTDNTAKIWDSAGKLIASLQENGPAVVYSASYNRSGRTFLSVGDDGTAKVWDARSGSVLQTFAGRGGIETHACWSPDGTRVAMADISGTVEIWDVESGRKVGSVGTAERSDALLDILWDVVFSPDGTRIATVQTHSAEALEAGTSDAPVADVWDTSTGKHLVRMTAPTDLRSARFSPDGMRLWTSTGDRGSMLWDAKTGDMLAILGKHDDDITAAAFNPSGDTIATASDDGAVKIWRTVDGTLLASLDGHTSSVRMVTFSPNGELVATASRDFTARVWDAASGRLRHKLADHKDFVNSARFSSDGSRLVTASGDGLAIIWDTRTGARMATLAGHEGAVSDAEFSPDGTTVLTAGVDGTIRIWDAVGGKASSVVRAHEGPTSISDVIGLGPAGRKIATVHESEGSNGQQRTVRIWDLATGASLAAIPGLTGDVNDIAFNPDESKLATASDDQTVRVWDADSGKLLLSISGHEDRVNSVAFGPDGRNVASASDDRTAKVWDAESGALLFSLAQHTDDVNFVAFSPDGTRIVTVDDDRTARVWSAGDGKFLFDITKIAGARPPIMFTPDGAMLVAATTDEMGAAAWSTHTGDRILSVALPIQDAGISRSNLLEAAWLSGDGNFIVGTTDEAVALWDIAPEKRSPEELAAEVRCHMALALDERNEIVPAKPDPLACRTVGEGALAPTVPAARAEEAVARKPTPKRQMEGAQLVATLPDEGPMPVRSASFSRDGSRILTVGQTAKVWTTDGSLVFSTPPGLGLLIEGAALDSSGELLGTAHDDDSARVFRIEDGTLVGLLQGHGNDVLSVAFSPDGERIVTSSRDGTARIWHAIGGTQIAVFEGHTAPVLSATFSPDGKHILTASEDGTARLWNAANGSLLHSLPASEGKSYFLSASFSRDGSRVLTAAGDLRAVVWDAATGERLVVLSQDLNIGFVAAFDTNAARVVTAGLGGIGEVWDASSGERLLSLRGHEKGKLLTAASFSADGRRILTASEDGTARVWKAADGTAVATMKSQTGSVAAARFSPDGELIVTADEDGPAAIWKLLENDGE